ncbi:MAG: hypothetical protein ACM359_03835 [Bacillota bacterium]
MLTDGGSSPVLDTHSRGNAVGFQEADNLAVAQVLPVQAANQPAKLAPVGRHRLQLQHPAKLDAGDQSVDRAEVEPQSQWRVGHQPHLRAQGHHQVQVGGQRLLGLA